MNPAHYDAWYDTPRGRWIGETEYRLIKQQLNFQSGEKILDVGCGTGWFTRRIAHWGDLYVTGLDISPEWLAFARKRDPNAHYVQGDALALPFHNNSFDSVISVAALCFTEDWKSAIREIIRVCRGGFAIGMLNRQSLLWRDKGRNGGSGAYQGAHWVTPSELIGSVRHLPVTDVRLRSAIPIPSGTPMARCIEILAPHRFLNGGFIVIAGRKSPSGITYD